MISYSTLANYCTHRNDIGVDCEGTLIISFCAYDNQLFMIVEACVNGTIRLSGNSFSNQGRVEVCVDNNWGTICPDSWDNNDAAVACYQLGHLRSGIQYHVLACM